MESITVTRPGRYKRVKQYAKNRRCRCGTRLSVYNKRDLCYTCDRR